MRQNTISDYDLQQSAKEISKVLVGNKLYIVTPIFKENSEITVVNKISRLIQTETNKSLIS